MVKTVSDSVGFFRRSRRTDTASIDKDSMRVLNIHASYRGRNHIYGIVCVAF